MKGFKEFLKTNKYTKDVFRACSKTYYRLLAKISNSKKRRLLHKYGFEIISKVQKALEENGVFFFFDMGTLLGIIREGQLIKHDLDIDVAVFASSDAEKEKIQNIFTSMGAEEKKRYSIKEFGIIEQSFVYSKVKFDINYFNTRDDNDYCYLMYKDPEKTYKEDEISVVELKSPHVEKTVLHKFGSIEVNVPENPEEYLANRYGANWRIPDKKYLYWRGPSTSPTDYVGIYNEM